MRRLLLFPYAFVLMNWAAVRALFCFLRRRRLASLWVDDAAAAGRAPYSAFQSRRAEEMLESLSGVDDLGSRSRG